MATLIVSPRPTVGLVIGTFAAIPYVHLQLESRQRWHPDLPVLVCDDGSARAEETAALCDRYGAEFRSRERRLPPTLGDLAAVAAGLDWAEANGLELLVKFSRRFIPLSPWVDSLSELAYARQDATYSAACNDFGFDLRTEAIAYHTPSWIGAGGRTSIQRAVAAGRFQLVEEFLHEVSARVREQCVAPPPPPSEAGQSASASYWPILGRGRLERRLEFLWHDTDTPVDYARVARLWDLPYGVEDFVDPNMGEGDGA